MSATPIVLKVSGDYVEKPEVIGQLAEAVAEIIRQQPCVLVHGGGRAIDEWLKRAGIEPAFKDGLRVTDGPTLEIVEMILSGLVNKRLVLALAKQGIDALGISGVDRQLICAEPVSAELGFVGKPVDVRADILMGLCDEGIVPVISPISAGPEGRYNVNADQAAGAIAGAIRAAKVIFLTNVSGVQSDGKLVEQLTAEETHQLITDQVITGGMIPKVKAALEALESGAVQVVITDLAGLHAGTGTAFVS